MYQYKQDKCACKLISGPARWDSSHFISCSSLVISSSSKHVSFIATIHGQPGAASTSRRWAEEKKRDERYTAHLASVVVLLHVYDKVLN